MLALAAELCAAEFGFTVVKRLLRDRPAQCIRWLGGLGPPFAALGPIRGFGPDRSEHGRSTVLAYL